MIENLGWQMNYYITAGYGMFIGVFAILFLREPKRGKFEVKEPESFLEQLQNESEDTNTIQNSEIEKKISFFG